ncbi:MAG: cyclic nucleotide-binding domain-containing protein [Motiliproteus sp.]
MKAVYPLQSCPLFGGVSDQQLPLIKRFLNTQSYAPGSYLFHQGDSGDQLFLITQGQVEVLEQSNGHPQVRLAIREAGDSIGEMCLIDNQNRSASVKALDAVEVLSLSNADIHRLYQHDAQLYLLIIMNIAREISRRLRSMDALLGSTLYAKKS